MPFSTFFYPIFIIFFVFQPVLWIPNAVGASLAIFQLTVSFFYRFRTSHKKVRTHEFENNFVHSGVNIIDKETNQSVGVIISPENKYAESLT